MWRNPNGYSGFTFLELTIVVAIVAVLVLIGLPHYRTYQAKARQAEAKANLSAIYIAEKAFAAESSSYTLCLNEIGFVPVGKNRYYTLGFGPDASNSTSCGPSGGLPCRLHLFSESSPEECDDSQHYFSAKEKVNDQSALPNQVALKNTFITQNSFRAAASGNISTTTTEYDQWTIDDSKDLVNTQPAY